MTNQELQTLLKALDPDAEIRIRFGVPEWVTEGGMAASELDGEYGAVLDGRSVLAESGMVTIIADLPEPGDDA